MTEINSNIAFFEGMNTDNKEDFLKTGEYRDAENLLIGSSSSNQSGAAEYLLGNEEMPSVSSLLPVGVNTMISAPPCRDLMNDAIILCYHNSNGNHSIIRFYAKDNKAEIIARSSVLNFSLDHKVYDSNVIEDKFWFNDRYNPPRKVNLSKGRWGGDDLRRSFTFDLFFGTANDIKENVQYSFVINGLAPSMPVVSVYSGMLPSDISLLTDLCYNMANALNANAVFYNSGFRAEGMADRVRVTYTGESTVFLRPAAYGGPWNPVVTVPSGALGWIVPIDYYKNLDNQDIDGIAYPPMHPIQPTFGTDETFPKNLLKGTRYQFSYRYIYRDYEPSRFCTASVIAIDETIIGADLLSTKKNYIELDYSDGGRFLQIRDKIVSVEIIARNGNSDPYQYIFLLSGGELTGSVRFYNDKSYNPVAGSLMNQPFDDVPELAGSQAVINNRVVYIGAKQGKDATPIDMRIRTTSLEIANNKISGSIKIKDFQTDALMSINSSNVVGGVFRKSPWLLPAGGFTVYLAGTSFRTVTKQTGTSQDFELTGIPDGRYILRIASHLV